MTTWKRFYWVYEGFVSLALCVLSFQYRKRCLAGGFLVSITWPSHWPLYYNWIRVRRNDNRFNFRTSCCFFFKWWVWLTCETTNTRTKTRLSYSQNVQYVITAWYNKTTSVEELWLLQCLGTQEKEMPLLKSRKHPLASSSSADFCTLPAFFLIIMYSRTVASL